MPVSVKCNGKTNSIVHKMSSGMSRATLPDVCKTPSPGGPVPVPYPNISQSIMLSKGTTTVKTDKMMAAIKGSEFSLSNGDNAGVAGGVKSSTFMKESTWITYAFTVKLDGKNACRLSDKKFQNHQNTVNLGGTQNPKVSVEDFEEYLKKCVDDARTSVDGKNPNPPKTDEEWEAYCKKNAKQRGIDIGKEAEACIKAKMEEEGASDELSCDQPYSTGGGPRAVGSPGQVLNGTCRPDFVLHAPGDMNKVRGVYDCKATCPEKKNEPQWGERGAFNQGENYLYAFGRAPKIAAPGYRIGTFAHRATENMRKAARLLKIWL